MFKRIALTRVSECQCSLARTQHLNVLRPVGENLTHRRLGVRENGPRI